MCKNKEVTSVGTHGRERGSRWAWDFFLSCLSVHWIFAVLRSPWSLDWLLNGMLTIYMLPLWFWLPTLVQETCRSGYPLNCTCKSIAYSVQKQRGDISGYPWSRTGIQMSLRFFLVVFVCALEFRVFTKWKICCSFRMNDGDAKCVGRILSLVM